MEQEYKNVAIVGAGASGCICAYFLLKSGINVTLFDKNKPLLTLLPTGGGRCNLAHAEYDFKELAKNYLRGEKFLYSIFSRFSTIDTIELFKKLGVETYTQDDGKIFPASNSSSDVREKILRSIKNAEFVNDEVKEITSLDNGFKIKAGKSEYLFSHVVIAVGGHTDYDIMKNFELKIIPPKPSLVGLNTKEDFKLLSGTAVKNVKIEGFEGDIMFTHFGLTGPLVYKISSLKAFNKFPYKLIINFLPINIDLQEKLNSEPHKNIKNILSQYIPSKFAEYILNKCNINSETKAHQIDGKTRNLVLENLHNFEVNITGTNKGEETVTAGGIDLNEINTKNMCLKKYPRIYATGEVLNIDGLCGGFNLQNAWSTAFVCAEGILSD